MRRSLGVLTAAAVLMLAFPADARLQQEPRIEASATWVAGRDESWRIAGLEPGQTVRVHTVGRYERWEGRDGQFAPVRRIMHSWADFVADREGLVDGATATPSAGSYRTADPTGFLWSAIAEGAEGLPTNTPEGLYAIPEDATALMLAIEIDGAIVARQALQVASGGPDVRSGRIQGQANGWFAYDETVSGPRPTLIVLHGSEGGNWLGHNVARDYAARGFAVLTLDYFAPTARAVPGLPTSLAEVPLETLQQAYDWLAARPEVDAGRVAVIGTSRGAELALLTGVVFDWPAAIVACVPSDVVTDGYGETAPLRNRTPWTFRGEPLDFAPFIDEPGRFASGAEAFRASFLAYPDQLASARIRVEAIEEPLLLLGGEADTVWPSGEMVRRIVARRAEANLQDRTEAHVYPGAGHQICGSGVFPLRLYGVDGQGDRNLSMLAEGEATRDAWRRQIDFLREALR